MEVWNRRDRPRGLPRRRSCRRSPQATHGLITGILDRIAELGKADPAEVGPELDGLAAVMESHFRFEERALPEALDAGVPVDGWSDPVLRLKPPQPTP
ncbi:hypothetical protein [Actinoplanes sp. NPDC020271]|uniref:hypothetical protein n=1 Tax=Actinoplanes sp. NPDC020271 TaxID=3363896 RepID=UPI0037A472EF